MFPREGTFQTFKESFQTVVILIIIFSFNRRYIAFLIVLSVSQPAAVRTQRKTDLKNREYKQFCADNGLTPQTERAKVNGDRRISSSHLKDFKNCDILKQKFDKGKVSLSINPEMQNHYILGRKEYIKKVVVTLLFPQKNSSIL